MHQHSSLCFYSNLFFLVPLYVAYKGNMKYIGVSIAVTAAASMAYHFDEKNPAGLYMDMGSSVVLGAVALFYMLRMRHVLTGSNLLGLLCAVFGAHYFILAQTAGAVEDDETGEVEYTEEYYVFHTYWHILLVCALTAFVHSVSHEIDETILTQPLRPLVQKIVFGEHAVLPAPHAPQEPVEHLLPVHRPGPGEGTEEKTGPPSGHHEHLVRAVPVGQRGDRVV